MIWTPLSLLGHGLYGWWDASLRRSFTTYEYSGAVYALSWKDVAFGRVMVSSSFSAGPIISNVRGRAGLVGAPHCGLALPADQTVFGASGEATIIAVARTLQDGPANLNNRPSLAGRIVSWRNVGSSNDYSAGGFILMDDYVFADLRAAVWSGDTRLTAPVRYERPSVLAVTFWYNASFGLAFTELWVDGRYVGGASIGGIAIDPVGTLSVNNSLHNSPNEYLSGELHELIVVSRRMAAPEIVMASRALMQKWRIGQYNKHRSVVTTPPRVLVPTIDLGGSGWSAS